MNDPEMLKHLDALFQRGKQGPPKKEKKKKTPPEPKVEEVKPPTPKHDPTADEVEEDKSEDKSESQSRQKYVVDMSERPQDPGSINELLLREQEEARRRKERMEKNPVTVETLDNFSNLDKSASKSPRRDLDPVQYAEYLEGKINMVEELSRNNIS